MFDCDAVVAELRSEDADPRIDPSLVRCLRGTDGTGSVLLIGVVHDHPASVFRVSSLLESFPPDVLAVELPPLSVPLFCRYARDSHVPPRLGGEMSAAIDAADAARVVGIDAPNSSYLRALIDRLRTDGEARTLARAMLTDFVRGLAQAAACRLGAVVAALTPYVPRVYAHIRYDVTLLDDPETQADHERRHLAQHRAFVGVVDPPPETAIVDRIREDVMAARIAALRDDGDIAVVVGMHHLDELERWLAALGSEDDD
ncbi:hypothetical protein [Halobaculum gomorrense]|uniref:Uncharacterized protein n=1 Tax=Halobaculum gomorrense TaxID=43928 RepID=A0A1M5PLT3_9EURY|nr:hypothetical protein [Halobaculum gomorrense]SHH02223.1 hypothetical protein SAMN05443636_1641 [Halobaculum gomorrense]